MTSIMLAKADIGKRSVYLVMDEQNRLSYVTGDGSSYRITEKPSSLILAYQIAEESVAVLPREATVHWLFNVHCKKLERLAHEAGKSRDDVYRIVVAEAMVRDAIKGIKTRDDLKRRVSMEVRFLPQLIEDPSESDRAEIVDTVENMGKLTPKELAQLFPAEKRYDGGGDFKDYFTSAKFLKSLKDEPLGAEGALKFMWDYQNEQLINFTMLIMKAVDNDRKRQGKPSMGEEFAHENGIPIYRKTTVDGKPVLLDEEGNAVPLNEEEKNHDKS